MRLTIHNLLHGNHASALGVQGQTQDSHGGRNLIIAGESRRVNAAAAMSLHVEAAASVHLALRTTASAGEAWSSGLFICQ
jgi:hypothetical protein